MRQFDPQKTLDAILEQVPVVFGTMEPASLERAAKEIDDAPFPSAEELAPFLAAFKAQVPAALRALRVQPAHGPVCAEEENLLDRTVRSVLQELDAPMPDVEHLAVFLSHAKQNRQSVITAGIGVVVGLVDGAIDATPKELEEIAEGLEWLAQKVRVDAAAKCSADAPPDGRVH